MEKRYGLDCIQYLTDIVGGAGTAKLGPQAVPLEERIWELRGRIARAARELRNLEAELREMEALDTRAPGHAEGIFRRFVRRFRAQEG